MGENEIYYRIQVDSNGELRVCCLQWFDEYGYDERRWLTPGNFSWLASIVPLKDKYATEQEALAVVGQVALHRCETYLRTVARAIA